MRWSYKIGRFAGIEVLIHFTFILFIGWVALMHWRQGQSAIAVLAGVSFILIIFLCIVLHELGHALMAKRYGIKTKDIILLPIGGVARLERLPTKPLQELWVALAGPAVNVIIAILLSSILRFSTTLEPLDSLSLTTGPFLERLMMINIFMIIFNLIPAFPMDGGRVLRAILAMQTDYRRATQIAASVGRVVATLFGFVGFFYNPFLIFIALFIWIGASQESRLVQLKSAIRGITVEQAMTNDYKALHSSDSLNRAIELTRAGSQKDFPVLSDGNFKGILTQNDLLKALSEGDKDRSVVSAVQKKAITLDSLDFLESAFEKLNACDCQTLPVMRNDKLVGLVTRDNLSEYMRFQAAIND